MRTNKAHIVTKLSFVSAVLLVAQPVRAEDPGDDFSNNLFSDLAPLLALFGEQVAKQFLSQSLSWLDSVIFAMAPLGIITAIVSAIRVGGPRWLRAVIGRARESKGDAELELMSSTSADVCELWNGETIVRTLGSPYITEILWLEKTDAVESIDPDSDVVAQESLLASNSSTLCEDDDKAHTSTFGGIYSLEDAEKAKIIKTKHSGAMFTLQELSPSQLFEHEVFELEALEPISSSHLASHHRQDPEQQKPVFNATKSPPNLSLNVSGEPTSKLELAAVAVCSTILQCGVIIFEIIITYLRPFNQRFDKGGSPAVAYACPLTVGGTCLVVIGMYICCKVVQERSKEEIWDVNKFNIPPGYRLNVAWLQRHQIVTDQNFGAFCLYAPPNRTRIMSSWFNTNGKSQNFSTLVGTAVSVVGFVVQFTGLRGMHYSATLAQLAATLIVALFRIMIRRQLGNRPILEPVPDGQELDWMARKTTRCSKWAVKPLSPANPPDYEDPGTFLARYKLREICPWPLEDTSTASMAESLARSFEAITNYVYSSDIELTEEAQNMVSFEFPVHVAYSRLGSKDSHRANIKVKMYRDVVSDDRNSSWTGWKTDRYALEAILTLWKLSVAEDEEQPDTGYNDRAKSIILLGPSSDFHILDYDIFIGQSQRCLHMKNGLDDLGTSEFPVPDHRVFGYIGANPKADHLALISFSYLSDLCARHILTCYFYQLCQFIQTLNGETTVLRNAEFNIDDSRLQMNNTHLDKIVDLLHSNGIPGTREDFFMILVPALQKNGNLLRVSDAFSTIIREAREAEATGSYPPISKDMLFHMADHTLKTFRNNSHWLYAGDFVFGLLETCQLVLGSDHAWTQTAEGFACRACHSIEAQLFCELEFQDKDGLKMLSSICQGLSSHCDRVLGKESAESQLLWRLYFKAKAKATVTTGVVELSGNIPSSAQVTPTRLYAGEETSPSTSPTQQLPIDPINPGLDLGEEPPDPIMQEIQKLKPSLDLSSIRKFPSKAWKRVKIQDLAALYALLKPKDERFVPEEVILISHTFIIATACGYSRVVGLCLTKFSDICCNSIGGAGTNASTAITFATINNDPVIVDLILSSLDRSQITSLDNIRSPEDTNCLQIACREGFVDIAHLLLRAGVSPLGPGYVQDSTVLPLYLASRSNSTAIISLLLFYGAAASYQDFRTGETFLHHAIQFGAEETIDYILAPESGLSSLYYIQDCNGNTALDTAIIYGNDQTAIRLFNSMIMFTEFDLPNKQNSDGETPLHLACQYNRVELVRTFLAHGFKPDRRTDQDHTAFETAAIFGSCDVGAVLLEADAKGTVFPSEDGPHPIILAAKNTRTDYVGFLLDNGAPIDTKEELTFMTPILIATITGNSDLFDLLVAKGADTTAMDVDGQNIAHLAARSNGAHCLKSLFQDSQEAHRMLMVSRLEGETPFQLALWHGNFAAATVLLEQASLLNQARLNLTLPTSDGMSALHLICSLFSLVGDQETVSVRLKTPLHEYVKYSTPITRPVIPMLTRRPVVWGSQREEEAVEFLKLIFAKESVSSTIQDSFGLTALIYAVIGGQAEACKLMLEHDRNISLSKLQKPLQAALYTGEIAIIKLIVAAAVDVAESPEYAGHLSIESFLTTACRTLLQLTGRIRGKVSATGTAPVDNPEEFEERAWESDVELLACLQLFVDAGADLSTTKPEEWRTEITLLHAAIHCKSPEVIELLVTAGAAIDNSEAHRSLIHFALTEDPSYVVLIPALCRNGLDINYVDQGGDTPLTLEIERQRLATVTALLDNGATIRTTGDWPNLTSAAHKGSFDIFQLLCARFKQASTADEYITFLNGTSFPEWPTLHIAAKIGNEEIVTFLAEEGADMGVLDDQGCNALIPALDFPGVMRLLVRYGTDPNHKQRQLGATAAHYVIQTMDRSDEVIVALRTLFALGADFNITDWAGLTPMDYCTNGNRTTGWRANDWELERVLDEFKRHQRSDGRFDIMQPLKSETNSQISPRG